MPCKISRLFMTVLALVCLLACGQESPPSKTPGKAVPDAKAPDFTLKDLSGKSVKLSSLRGNPVLVIFSATWCPECRREIPYFKEIYATYYTKGLQIINVDIMEPEERVRIFADRHELPYRTLLDEEGRVAEKYGVYGIPTTLLIDKNGMILCYPCRSLDRLLDMIFAK